MSDTDDESRTRKTTEVALPVDLLARLHDAYPEARDNDAEAIRMALGDGLFDREREMG
jgi:hypothetical protein